MNTKYYPVLKTSVSELRALKSLRDHDFSSVVPLFELTKSRKSKHNQGCDVYRKIDELAKIMDDKPFILDLTNEESLSNEQIDSFFDEDNSFYNWTNFIHRIIDDKKVNVIPTILAYEDSEPISLYKQARRLLEKCEKICIRLSVQWAGEDITYELIQLASELEDVIIVIDLGLTRRDEYDTNINDARSIIEEILATDESIDIVLVSSSFPSSVVQEVPKKENMSNKIEMFTRKIYEELSDLYPGIIYGDYGCIHPFRGESKPMVWIPRIDYPYSHYLAFERCRREDGGYIECAIQISSLPDYKKHRIDCWGIDEIDSASEGFLNGKNPSFWISVRSNIHMTRMARLIQKENTLQSRVSNF
ncbi:beta family protein [Photobacterium ganghwense]|uniref:beta family protein n=1 Tax=Photobacterium ganghwense TaxID=320778 RepID=UPI0039F08BCA